MGFQNDNLAIVKGASPWYKVIIDRFKGLDCFVHHAILYEMVDGNSNAFAVLQDLRYFYDLPIMSYAWRYPPNKKPQIYWSISLYLYVYFGKLDNPQKRSAIPLEHRNIYYSI